MDDAWPITCITDNLADGTCIPITLGQCEEPRPPVTLTAFLLASAPAVHHRTVLDSVPRSCLSGIPVYHGTNMHHTYFLPAWRLWSQDHPVKVLTGKPLQHHRTSTKGCPRSSRMEQLDRSCQVGRRMGGVAAVGASSGSGSGE